MERVRAKRHARRLAQQSLRRAGTLKAVGRAMTPSRRESTVGHYVTDRTHPDLARAFELLIGLCDAEDVSARTFAEAVTELVELRDIVQADTETLIERGLVLMSRENELGYVEDLRSLTGHGHSEALRRVASASAELAAIIGELCYRGKDLHAIYRERGEVAA